MIRVEGDFSAGITRLPVMVAMVAMVARVCRVPSFSFLDLSGVVAVLII